MVNLGLFQRLLSVAWPSGGRLIAWDGDLLFESTNGGRTWRDVGSLPWEPDQLLVLSGGGLVITQWWDYTGEFWGSSDGGETWNLIHQSDDSASFASASSVGTFVFNDWRSFEDLEGCGWGTLDGAWDGGRLNESWDLTNWTLPTWASGGKVYAAVLGYASSAPSAGYDNHLYMSQACELDGNGNGVQRHWLVGKWWTDGGSYREIQADLGLSYIIYGGDYPVMKDLWVPYDLSPTSAGYPVCRGIWGSSFLGPVELEWGDDVVAVVPAANVNMTFDYVSTTTVDCGGTPTQVTGIPELMPDEIVQAMASDGAAKTAYGWSADLTARVSSSYSNIPLSILSEMGDAEARYVGPVADTPDSPLWPDCPYDDPADRDWPGWGLHYQWRWLDDADQGKPIGYVVNARGGNFYAGWSEDQYDFNVGAPGVILESGDGGRTWRYAAQLPGDPYYGAVIAGRWYLWCGDSGDRLVATSTNGLEWVDLYVDDTDWWPRSDPAVIDGKWYLPVGGRARLLIIDGSTVSDVTTPGTIGVSIRELDDGALVTTMRNAYGEWCCAVSDDGGFTWELRGVIGTGTRSYYPPGIYPVPS